LTILAVLSEAEALKRSAEQLLDMVDIGDPGLAAGIAEAAQGLRLAPRIGLLDLERNAF
jgi:hypothetical protein